MTETDLQLDISSPNETSSTGNGLYLIGFLAKKVPWAPVNNQDYYWQGSLLFSTSCKALLLKAALIQLAHGEAKLVPTWSLDPYGLVFMVLFPLPKGECKHQPSYKSFVLKWRPACKIF